MEVRQPQDAPLLSAPVELELHAAHSPRMTGPGPAPRHILSTHFLPLPEPYLRHHAQPHNGLLPPTPRPLLCPPQQAFLPLPHAENCTVRLWPKQSLTRRLKAGDVPCATELPGHEGPVSCCSFSVDGGSLATGGRDRVSCQRMRPLAPAAPCFLDP